MNYAESPLIGITSAVLNKASVVQLGLCLDYQDLSYSGRLSKLGLFSIQGRLTRADLILYWKIFHGKSYITPQSMFAHPQTATRGHPFKITARRTNTNIRQRFFLTEMY